MASSKHQDRPFGPLWGPASRPRPARPYWHKAAGPILGTALAAVLAFAFAGCNADPAASDETPPDHMIKAPNPQGKYRFGITDTLAVEFSEAIDTSALDLTFSDSAIAFSFRGDRRLIIFGTGQTHGISHFKVNTPFTATFNGLRDLSGNGRPSIEETFQPYAWTDRDFLDSTYDWYDSLQRDEDTWIDGSPVLDSLISEGSLDDRKNFGLTDEFDYKVFRVAAPDTLDFFLSTRKELELSLQLAGPFKDSGFAERLRDFDFDASGSNTQGTRRIFTGTTGSKGGLSHSLVTDGIDHKRELNDFDAAGIYVIRLGVPDKQEGFYRLGVRIRRFR
jgi:hypothetical protein